MKIVCKLHQFVFISLLLAGHVICQEESGEPPAGEDPPPEDTGPTEPPPPSCDGEYYEPRGTIESPNYPENYPDMRNCVYRILTNNYINVYFDSFDLEASEDCRFDFLDFIFKATSRDKKSTKYCGSGLDKVNDGHLRGQGPLIVAFKSDDSDNRAGFRMNFEFELTGPDPCESNPCQNEASCVTFTGYYTCECLDGYAGTNCEIDKDECLSYPCKNGGECTDGVDSYSCQCINGFEGELCEIEPDPCVSEPCQNGGLCVGRVVDYVCSCPRDFLGDHCEDAIPTPSPPPTTTTLAPSTTTPATSSAPEPDGEGGETPTSEVEPEEVPDPEPEPENEPPPPDDPGTHSNHNGVVTAAIVAVVLVALLLAAIFLWYWWKSQRSGDQEEDAVKKLDKEVTLINMKTNSEHGEGTEGKRHRRTTSINSVTMTTNPKTINKDLLRKLQRMSEGIIMEEVTPKPQGQVNPTYESPQYQPITSGYPTNPQIMPPANTIPNVPQPHNHSMNPVEQSPLKRISVPLTRNEAKQLDQNNKILSPTMYLPPQQRTRESVPGNYLPPQQYVSPDAAVNLLNQMKRNERPSFDFKNAFSQFGPNDYVKNPYQLPPPVNPPFQPIATVANTGLPRYPGQSAFPPNPPQFNKAPTAAPQNQPPIENNPGLELSPEEAAGVVNHLMMSQPRHSNPVSSEEAMDLIQKVRDDLYGSEPPPSFRREKSVFLQPNEAARILDQFRKRPKNSERGPQSGPSLASSYEPSDVGNKAPKWSQNFRECSPIREEPGASEEEQEVKEENTKKNRQNEEPVHKRVRKRASRVPSAKTLDPDEKVHDWLKSSPKFKKPGRKLPRNASPVSSVGTETHTLTTRPMPAKNDQRNNRKASTESNNGDEASSAMVHRTIKQTRRIVPDNKPILPITENKAKSLVEKLIKAPARSSQNIVGPGLTVERENAFVGDGKNSDYF